MARSDYAASDSRDARIYGIGAGLQWTPGEGTWRATLNYDYQRELADAAVHSNVRHGLSVLARTAPTDALGLWAGAGYNHSEYDAPLPAFGRTRRDEYGWAALGARYRVTHLGAKRVHLRLEVRRAEQWSNIDLYDYDRLRTAVTLELLL